MTFKKGVSGNPSGRAKGETPRGKFRKQVDAALPGIIEQLVAAALEGDVQAARLILDKILPNLKPQAEPVRLPLKGTTLSDQGAEVIAATAAGTLASDDAQAVMSLLSAQAKLIEQGEITERLAAIEEWLSKDKR